VANINSFFQSKYLKASDIVGGKQVTLTILRVGPEMFQDGTTKLVVGFQGVSKKMILNKTNCLAIAKVLGDDTDRWIHGKITLMSMPVSFQSRSVDAIRVIAVEAAPVAAQLPPELFETGTDAASQACPAAAQPVNGFAGATVQANDKDTQYFQDILKQ
jgi:hypothetical protein